jgi:hypothetical protein
MKPFFKDLNRIERVMNGVVAGTSDQTSSAVDMQLGGFFDEVTFVALFGALTASQVTSIKAQQSDDDAATDAYSDIEGSASSALADADGNKMLAYTVRPSKRYVKLIIDRGTANAVIDGIVVIKSLAKTIPVTQPSTIISWEVSDYPAEGTA